MSTSSSKGNAREKAAVAILESQGWLCWRAGKVLAWVNGQPRSQQHDIFGCADIIAAGGSVVRFIQVGTLEHRAKKQRKMQALAERTVMASCGSGVQCEVWAWIGGRRPDGQRFRVRRWNGLEWADCDDVVCVVETKRARAA